MEHICAAVDAERRVGRGVVVLTEGPSRENPEANHPLEINDLRPDRMCNNATHA